MIAALYVQPIGRYLGIEGVDLWDRARDARLYDGPWPVVAHPPCERWGRYWAGGPNAKVRKTLGSDDGCFAAALAAVRRWGGVLEHPEASHAWKAFGLNRPSRFGGWIPADFLGGWTCCVEQGHYGHPARKATWLYAHGVSLPELKWGACMDRQRLDEGFHSREERHRLRAKGQKPIKRLSRVECLETPPAFRDLLLSIAKSAHRE
jgi:hypothetical protein